MCPTALRKILAEHEIKTAQEMGWGRMKNGELIRRAEEGRFEVFMTSDQNLAYQQNLAVRRIALLILSTNYWPALRIQSVKIEEALNAIQPGQYVELHV